MALDLRSTYHMIWHVNKQGLWSFPLQATCSRPNWKEREGDTDDEKSQLRTAFHRGCGVRKATICLCEGIMGFICSRPAKLSWPGVG